MTTSGSYEWGMSSQCWRWMLAKKKKKKAEVPAALPRIGVWGLGYWGRIWVRKIQECSACRLAWGIDSDEHAVLRARNELRIPTYFGSNANDLNVREALPLADGVIIATPTIWHSPIAFGLIKYGLPILVEKPMGGSSVQWRELMVASSKCGGLMTGHTFLYSPVVEAARHQLIENQQLGAPRTVYASWTNWGKARMDTDAVFNVGPHPVSILIRLFGRKALGRAWVYRFSTKNALQATDRAGQAEILFTGGEIEGAVHLDWAAFHKTRLIRIVFEEGVAELDLLHDHQTLVIRNAQGMVSRNCGAARDPLTKELLDFIATIRAPRRHSISSAKVGLEVLQILEGGSP